MGLPQNNILAPSLGVYGQDNAVVSDADFKGGFRVVADDTARNAIGGGTTTENSRRVLGMMVYVLSSASNSNLPTYYTLSSLPVNPVTGTLTNANWTIANFGTSGFTAGGDLTGSNVSQTVSKIQGVLTPTVAPSAIGQVLQVSAIGGSPATSYALIVNANIDPAAAIVGSKIVPNFGSSAVTAQSLDTVATVGTDVLSLGTVNADEVHIGHTGMMTTVYGNLTVLGTTFNNGTTNTNTTDLLITLNKDGANGSPVSLSGVRVDRGPGPYTGGDGYAGMFWIEPSKYFRFAYNDNPTLGTTLGNDIPVYASEFHATGNVIRFEASASSPIFTQADQTANSTNGVSLNIRAQNATGTTSTGGNLRLSSGSGTTASGEITFLTGGSTTAMALNNKVDMQYLGQRVKVSTLTGNGAYTVNVNDYILAVDSSTWSTGSKTLTLPASGNRVVGDTYVIKDSTGTLGAGGIPKTIILAAAGSDTIDGAATFTMDVAFQSTTLVCTVAGGSAVWSIV